MNRLVSADQRFGVRGRPRGLAPLRWCPWCDGWGRVQDGSMTGSTTDCYHCRGTGEDQEHTAQAEQIAAVLALHASQDGVCGWCCEDADGSEPVWATYPCPTVRALGVTA